MSVMECSRTNCNNIMCEKYLESVGYICYECLEEFKKLCRTKYIREFMETERLTEIDLDLDP